MAPAIQISVLNAGDDPLRSRHSVRPARRWPALLLSALLHVGLGWSMIAALAAQQSARAVAAVVPPVMTAFLDLTSATSAIDAVPKPLHPTLAEPLLAVEEAPPPELDIEPIASDSFDDAKPIETAADAARIQELQGIYARQIDARLLRLLEVYGVPEFASTCSLKVMQDEQGRVAEVDFAECAVNDEDRQRLRRAILAASPLPRPPAGLAMGSYLTLDISPLLRKPATPKT